MKTTDGNPRVLTIGHSNHTMDRFVELLRAHGVQMLVDVRSSPYSRYSAHFCRDALDALLRRAGIRYVFMGSQLGGRPEDSSLYDEAGHVDYAQVAATPHFVGAIDRLLGESSAEHTVLMCSEEDPLRCHRFLLIARVLAERSVIVLHIRGDGRVQTHDDLTHQLQQATSQPQLALFTDGDRVEWKSPQSVSPRSRPRSSSESFVTPESGD